ncbi:DUF6452 family protein [Flavobacterium soyangense]|uniref:Lipoprotein n=1 Tax=Flavobacterium soyangense TaxID=2023265 RepID=A0A930XWQ9_9FLAO|nr:DUF6452 family protein [Flavobacterium soyangense]MBF2709651.1 hypothetical protein [Flavobacterium soyangense]
MKKILILLLIAMFTVSSCEKDDICDANTPTTPRLVIVFYDINNPSVLKNVTNLKVIGDGKTEGIVFNSATDDSKYLTNGSTISIPLKTDSNTTKYSFILNSGNANPTLTDIDEVTFNYTRSDIFVSRACGFKTLFTFDPSNPFVHASVPETKLKWMQYISIEKSNIANENETHIKVFF